LKQFSVLADAT